ncbi:hypothetical protein AAF712_011853 [Marasmius tenuissimus]|uniref:RING-type E3 ubiquitin transferase n=1 Tax=Marasmius tenuissimus TaxID=585030 RepID=A0ABR2ZK02_9AGAR
MGSRTPSRSSSPPQKRIKLEEEPHEDEEIPEDLDEDHCSICLQAVADRTVVPTCSHEFCFECLLIWTEQSRRCPLCSQNIGEHVIHNIRSRYDYQKHFLPPLRSKSPQMLPLRTSALAGNRRRTRIPREIRQRSRREREERIEADRFERAVEHRRWLYKHDLYAKHVASNSHTRYRPYPTPAQFSASQELISRATTFLRRELLVWPDLDIEFLTTFIISLMKAIDIRSESAVKLLAEFLDMDAPYVEGRRHVNAEHFAHEVYSYIRSPYKDLFIYDEMAQYGNPPPDSPPRRAREQHTSRWRETSSSRSHSHGHSHRRPSPSQSLAPHNRVRGRERSRSRSHRDTRNHPPSPSWSPSGRTYPSLRSRDVGRSYSPGAVDERELDWDLIERRDRPRVGGGSRVTACDNEHSSPSPTHIAPDIERHSLHHGKRRMSPSQQLTIKAQGKQPVEKVSPGALPEEVAVERNRDSNTEEWQHSNRLHLGGRTSLDEEAVPNPGIDEDSLSHCEKRSPCQQLKIKGQGKLPAGKDTSDALTKSVTERCFPIPPGRELSNGGHAVTATATKPSHDYPTSRTSEHRIVEVPSSSDTNTMSEAVVTRPSASRRSTMGERDAGTPGQGNEEATKRSATVTRTKHRNLVDSVQAHLNPHRGAKPSVRSEYGRDDNQSGPKTTIQGPSPPPDPPRPVASASLAIPDSRPSLLLRLSDVCIGDDLNKAGNPTSGVIPNPTPRQRQSNPLERVTEADYRSGPSHRPLALLDPASSIATSCDPGDVALPKDRLTQLRNQPRNESSPSHQSLLEQSREKDSLAIRSRPNPNLSSSSSASMDHDIRMHVGSSSKPSVSVDPNDRIDKNIRGSNTDADSTGVVSRSVLLQRLEDEKQKMRGNASSPANTTEMEARLRMRARLNARLASEKRSGAAADSSKG